MLIYDEKGLKICDHTFENDIKDILLHKNAKELQFYALTTFELIKINLE